jgi:hypothetical protein
MKFNRPTKEKTSGRIDDQDEDKIRNRRACSKTAPLMQYYNDQGKFYQNGIEITERLSILIFVVKKQCLILKVEVTIGTLRFEL